MTYQYSVVHHYNHPQCARNFDILQPDRYCNSDSPKLHSVENLKSLWLITNFFKNENVGVNEHPEQSSSRVH